jgi:plastocyanin
MVMTAVMFAAVALVACGGGDDDDDSPGSGGNGASAPIEVRMLDIAYQSTGVRGTVGQETTLNLKNDGAQPHTFTITGLVDSGQVAAGQSKTITFKPTQAGQLTFFCTVHGQAAMSGTMTVN